MAAHLRSVMRSRNEVEGMVLKAARGAGVPLGHAEDFARAVGILAMCNPEALPSLLNALDGPFEVTISEAPLTLTGPLIMCAPMAIDALRAGEPEVVLANVTPPELLDAYLQNAAQDYDLHVKNDNGHLTQSAKPQTPDIPVRTVTVPDALWLVWETHAEKTYVPETESSRLAGAGAGLTDND